LKKRTKKLLTFGRLPIDAAGEQCAVARLRDGLQSSPSYDAELKKSFCFFFQKEALACFASNYRSPSGVGGWWVALRFTHPTDFGCVR